jgi:hypothetical protein
MLSRLYLQNLDLLPRVKSQRPVFSLKNLSSCMPSLQSTLLDLPPAEILSEECDIFIALCLTFLSPVAEFLVWTFLRPPLARLAFNQTINTNTQFPHTKLHGKSEVDVSLAVKLIRRLTSTSAFSKIFVALA